MIPNSQSKEIKTRTDLPSKQKTTRGGSGLRIVYTSPNQKCIITKKTLSDEKHLYSRINLAAVCNAAKHLSDRAFKLYIRMNLHQDQYTYALSPVEIENSIGMSPKRYVNAVKELVAKGYLIQDQVKSNVYTFYEAPKVDAPAIFRNQCAKPRQDGCDTDSKTADHTTILVRDPAPTRPMEWYDWVQSSDQCGGRNITDKTRNNTLNNTNDRSPYTTTQYQVDKLDEARVICVDEDEYARLEAMEERSRGEYDCAMDDDADLPF